MRKRANKVKTIYLPKSMDLQKKTIHCQPYFKIILSVHKVYFELLAFIKNIMVGKTIISLKFEAWSTEIRAQENAKTYEISKRLKVNVLKVPLIFFFLVFIYFSSKRNRQVDKPVLYVFFILKMPIVARNTYPGARNSILNFYFYLFVYTF